MISELIDIISGAENGFVTVEHALDLNPIIENAGVVLPAVYLYHDQQHR